MDKTARIDLGTLPPGKYLLFAILTNGTFIRTSSIKRRPSSACLTASRNTQTASRRNPEGLVFSTFG